MSKVYVIQDVNGKNISPAKEFGDLHVILTGKELSNIAQSKLQDALHYMTRDDFILLIGHPINIAMAAHIALKKLGTVKFLVWHRQRYEYEIDEVHA